MAVNVTEKLLLPQGTIFISNAHNDIQHILCSALNGLFSALSA